MPKFKVSYTFNGYGEVIVDALNEEDASGAFDNGEFGGKYGPDEVETGEDYTIYSIREMPDDFQLKENEDDKNQKIKEQINQAKWGPKKL